MPGKRIKGGILRRIRLGKKGKGIVKVAGRNAARLNRSMQPRHGSTNVGIHLSAFTEFQRKNTRVVISRALDSIGLDPQKTREQRNQEKNTSPLSTTCRHSSK